MRATEAQITVETPSGTKSKEEKFDPLPKLCSVHGPWSDVSMGLSSALPYGEIKVSAYVRLSCDQTQEKVDSAQAIAMDMALKYVTEALEVIVSELAEPWNKATEEFRRRTEEPK